MNYIGSKQTLLPFLERVFRRIATGDEIVFCDLFAGTGAVGRFFKRLGLRIIANDIQYYAYALNKAYLEIDYPPRFLNLLSVYKPLIDDGREPVEQTLSLVNKLHGRRGFISENYAPRGGRLYYTDENAERVDAIRESLEEWRSEGLISEHEYFYLLCSLLEAIDQVANTASVYGAFLKQFKATALRPLELRAIELSDHVRGCCVFQEDANELIERIECDVLYLDPPYNHRQYGANYHVLETIASNDRPNLRGVTGMRDYARSRYCVPSTAGEALADLVAKARTQHILFSYNDEGVIGFDEVRRILAMRGRVTTFKTTYSRFKADRNRTYKRETTTEYLHHVKIGM